MSLSKLLAESSNQWREIIVLLNFEMPIKVGSESLCLYWFCWWQITLSYVVECSQESHADTNVTQRGSTMLMN